MGTLTLHTSAAVGQTGMDNSQELDLQPKLTRMDWHAHTPASVKPRVTRKPGQ